MNKFMNKFMTSGDPKIIKNHKKNHKKIIKNHKKSGKTIKKQKTRCFYDFIMIFL